MSREENLKRVAMSVVNKLYELAELTVNQRQSLNDKADEIVIEAISLALKEQRERTVEMAEKLKIPMRENEDGPYRLQTDVSYNNALEDIITSLGK